MLTALGGAEGLQQAAANKPDVVLLDMKMPGMDGFEVMRELRLQPDTRDLPVIFLTADNERENLVRRPAHLLPCVPRPTVFHRLLARAYRIDHPLQRSQRDSVTLCGHRLPERTWIAGQPAVDRVGEDGLVGRLFARRPGSTGVQRLSDFLPKIGWNVLQRLERREPHAMLSRAVERSLHERVERSRGRGRLLGVEKRLQHRRRGDGRVPAAI